MKNKAVFFGLIFVVLLYNIIAIDSYTEEQYELFYTISPLVVMFSILVLNVTVNKISRYLLIGLLISNLLTQVFLTIATATSVKFTVPKLSFYLFVILMFVLYYCKQKTPIQKESGS